jgi:hypothetical protein
VLIGLVIVMVILAVMAAAMVTITSTSSHSYLWTGSGNQARLLAESGYRYSFLKYESEDYQTDRNDILAELNDNEYQLNPTDQGKKFKIEVESHWFEAAANAYSASPSPLIDTSTFGDPPAQILSGGRAGYIKVWEGTQYPKYSSISQVGNLFRFWLTGPMTQTTVRQAVYLVCLVQGNHTVTKGSNLPLQYDAATDNGVYLFPDSKAYIEVVLAPNDTRKLSYKSVDLATRSLTGLDNHPSYEYKPTPQFPFNVSHGDRVLLWPYFQVDSTGTWRDAQAKATFGKGFHPKDMNPGPPEISLDLDNLDDLGPGVTKSGDVTEETQGVIGKAAKLTAAGQGYIEVDASVYPGLEVSGLDKVTVQAWVKKSSAQSGWVAIAQKSDYSYNLQLENGNIPVFTIWDGADRYDAAGVWKSAKARFRLANDVWYLLTGTFDSSATETTQQVYYVTLDQTTASDRALGHRRGIYPASALTDFSGNQVRVKFVADPTRRLTIAKAYIGERDGATYNMKAVPIKSQLTFNGGGDGVIINAGRSAWSDWVSFPVDGTVDLLVSYEFGAAPSFPYFAIIAPPSEDKWWESWEHTNGADQDTAPPGGTTLPFRAGVGEIEARVGNVKLYVDGMLEGTNSASQVGDATGWNVGIGANLDTGNRYFDGYLDDVRIYSRALAPEEILDYYNWYTPK